MADIEELVLKIGVEVDQGQLKRLRDEIEKLKSEGRKNAINIGLTGERPSVNEHGQTTNPVSGVSSNYSDEIVALLSLSEKHMLEMLNILKADHSKKSRSADSEDKDGKLKIPFVNDISSQGLGGAAGGVAGGAVGALGGPGGILAGASIGSAIGQLFEKIFSGIKEKVELVSKLFDERLTEDIHFRQLSHQTGLTVDSIYKLGVQARLAGSSLEEVVDSNQTLADELITGISDKKAQLLLALNINPRQALIESGGDIGKLNQLIFQRSTKALEGSNAYYKTSVLKGLGFSPEEQTSRQYLYRSDTRARAEGIYNSATLGGKIPLHTGEELQKEVLDFRGGIEDFKASIRSALTVDNLAKSLSTKLMNVKAGVVQLLVGAVSDITGLPEAGASKETIQSNNEKNIIRLNKTTDENVKQKEYIDKLIHHQNTPASAAGAAKAAVP